MLSDRRKRGAVIEGECVCMCVREINSQRETETVRERQRQSETKSDSLTSRIISLNEVTHPL